MSKSTLNLVTAVRKLLQEKPFVRLRDSRFSLTSKELRCLKGVNIPTMETANEGETKEDLKRRLSPLQYHVTQEKGTEKPFSGKFNKTYDDGVYKCVVCGQELFSSDTKYDSGCGWPAFNDVLDKGLVKLSKDTSNGKIRTEVQCSKCDAHLGHVFDDGPRPTGKRFCINSASLDFCPKSVQQGN